MDRSEALRQQLASLSNRLEALERQVKQIRAGTDSEFRRHVRAVSPWPLEQIYEFHLVLNPKFWQEKLKVTADELANATHWGDRFPLHTSRVSIERWRSHRHIRLYGEANKPCPTRVLLLKEPVDFELVHFWRMDFGAVRDERRVELYMEDEAIRLGAVGGEFGHGFRHGRNYNDGPGHGPSPAGTFVDVPLHHSATELEKYRTLDDEEAEEDSAAERFYQHADEAAGLSWNLRVQDLRSLHESEIVDLDSND